MSTSSNQLPIGQVIGNRYRVQSLIGRGGMGLVYSATHELTARRVALKLMLPDTDESPVLQERFLSEARTAAAVRHPNIVDVLDMGLHDGAPYLVMELIEGVSLERLLEAQTRLSAEQALSWLFPIMGALAVLHDAGIVHRDVKPSNIILSTLPRHPMRPKLLDFGLARVVSDLRLTRSGTVIGTPLYMAPEHAAGMITGPQADVWSLAVVMFECLSGRSPFNYSDRSSLAAQVLAGLVRPLAEVQPELPESLSLVLGRALQRDLTRRFVDMRSFAHALHSAARSAGMRLPADPDPIGLPDYAAWESGQAGAGVTWEADSSPRVPSAFDFGTDGSAERARVGSGSGSGSGAAGRRSSRPDSGSSKRSSASGSSAHDPFAVSDAFAPTSSESELLAQSRRTSRSGRLVLIFVLVAASAGGLYAFLQGRSSSRAGPASLPTIPQVSAAPDSLAPGNTSATTGSVTREPTPSLATSAPALNAADAGSLAPPTGRPATPNSATNSVGRSGSHGRRTPGQRSESAKPRPAGPRERPSSKEEEVESEWK